MNFYIRQIKLWFKRKVEPRVYTFEPNKVNVITGDSSTGKSSILRIIDYCLLSERSTIVEDVINQNVSWYGLAFTLNGVDYVVARQSPENETPEQRVFFAEGDEFPSMPMANVSRGELLLKFNGLFHIPNATFKMERKKTEVSLNFRHFLIFCYLTEDIIATMSTYFDTHFFSNSLGFDYYLDDFINIALGIEDPQQDELMKSYAEGKKRLEAESKKRIEHKKKDEAYRKALFRLKKKFVSLGLGEDDLFQDVESLLRIVKAGLRNFEKYSDNSKLMKELDGLRNESKTLTAKIAKYNSLKNEYARCQKIANSQRDSLAPLDYLNDHIEEVLDYEDTRLLVNSLRDSLRMVKEIGNHNVELPADFERHYQNLIAKKQAVDAQISKMNHLSRSAESVMWMHEAVKLRVDLENLKEPKFKGLADAAYEDLKTDVANKKDKLDRLSSNRSSIEQKLDDAIDRYYGSQRGISESYNACDPHFSMDEKMLMLKSVDSDFYKRNVGSKSNYMFLHLCFFLGLHDYLLQQKNSFVPNFLFIDQPSIPYYADKDNHADGKLNDDEKKLQEAFYLMNHFMEVVVGFERHDFQIILIEHAESKYWDNYSYFKTRYVFTKDKDFGLIPKLLARQS